MWEESGGRPDAIAVDLHSHRSIVVHDGSCTLFPVVSVRQQSPAYCTTDKIH
jgi:hypothetical protein